MAKLAFKRRKIITDAVRVAYPTLITPKAFKEGDKEYYSIKAFFPNGDLKVKCKTDNGPMVDTTISAVIAELKKEVWTANQAGNVAGYESPMMKGDESDKEWLMGHIHFNAKQFPDSKVLCLDGGKNVIEPNKIYSGCYCKLQCYISPWDTNGKKGIRFQLLAVQFVRDGEQITGGSTASADDFETVEGVQQDSAISDF